MRSTSSISGVDNRSDNELKRDTKDYLLYLL